MSSLSNAEAVRLVKRVAKLENQAKRHAEMICLLIDDKERILKRMAESNQLLIEQLRESNEVQQLLVNAVVCGPSNLDPNRGPAVRALRKYFRDKARD